MPDLRPSSHTQTPIIELTQLGKTYRNGSVEVHALRHVDLTIRQGEFVAIIGQSGSGKTTLLDILYVDKKLTSVPYKIGYIVRELARKQMKGGTLTPLLGKT